MGDSSIWNGFPLELDLDAASAAALVGDGALSNSPWKKSKAARYTSSQLFIGEVVQGFALLVRSPPLKEGGCFLSSFSVGVDELETTSYDGRGPFLSSQFTIICHGVRDQTKILIECFDCMVHVTFRRCTLDLGTHVVQSV